MEAIQLANEIESRNMVRPLYIVCMCRSQYILSYLLLQYSRRGIDDLGSEEDRYVCTCTHVMEVC